jgi:hypothetical protein
VRLEESLDLESRQWGQMTTILSRLVREKREIVCRGAPGRRIASRQWGRRVGVRYRVEGRRRRVPLRRGIARVTLVERKGMGAVQRRRGPNAVGVYGRRTPIADGRKLRRKETVVPRAADRTRYRRAPVRTFGRARRGWGRRPGEEGRGYTDIKRGVRVRLRASGRGVYGIIIAGWASNSKYARRGGRRTAAQMMSYERTRGRVVAVRRGRGGTGNRRGRGKQQRRGSAGKAKKREVLCRDESGEKSAPV